MNNVNEFLEIKSKSPDLQDMQSRSFASSTTKAGVFAKQRTGVLRLFLIMITVCAAFAPSGWAQSTTSSPLSVLDGVWALDSVKYVQGENEEVKLSGPLPKEIYYTCPVKIEGKTENDCVLHFDNAERKNVFYYVYTLQNRDYIHFSFEGQTSAPERRNNYFLKKDKNRLILKLNNSEAGEVLDAGGIQYVYYYSLRKK
jgi:hypothetical protein